MEADRAGILSASALGLLPRLVAKLVRTRRAAIVANGWQAAAQLFGACADAIDAEHGI
jgi:hypothetical protein